MYVLLNKLLQENKRLTFKQLNFEFQILRLQDKCYAKELIIDCIALGRVII